MTKRALFQAGSFSAVMMLGDASAVPAPMRSGLPCNRRVLFVANLSAGARKRRSVSESLRHLKNTGFRWC